MSSESDKANSYENFIKHASRSVDRSQIFLITIAVIIIIFVVVIVSEVQVTQQKAFSEIVTVGPVWLTNSWTCTSDSDFMVYGALRGLEGSMISIKISDLGTQSLYSLNAGKMETFSIGAPANHIITITRNGTLSGYLTLQTTSGAKASCTQI